MARKTKEDMEKTRQLILQSALDLFCKNGYSKTTFDSIAKHINLTKGAVYWHFKNKPDILLALMQKIIVEHMHKSYREPQTLAGIIEGFYDAAQSIQADEAQRKFMFFMHFQLEWSEEIFTTISSQVKELCEVPLKKLCHTFDELKKAGEVDENIDSLTAAEVVSCVWCGLLQKFVLNEDGFDLATKTKAALSLALNSMKKESK